MDFTGLRSPERSPEPSYLVQEPGNQAGEAGTAVHSLFSVHMFAPRSISFLWLPVMFVYDTRAQERASEGQRRAAKDLLAMPHVVTLPDLFFCHNFGDLGSQKQKQSPAVGCRELNGGSSNRQSSYYQLALIQLAKRLQVDLL